MRFNEFSVGDYVTFSRRFGKSEFRAFQRLSGDSNPLHHDEEYGAKSEFGQTIVPLHLVVSPLSAIAGMHFPGDPSLYLGHELRALLPVHFGDSLDYSARITAINNNLRVLSLAVVVLRGVEVVVEGQMRVQSRLEEWETVSQFTRVDVPSALITGASGGIGSAIALELARRGWRLWLHARKDTPELQKVAADCQILGSNIQVVVSDLERSAERSLLTKRMGDDGAPPVLVHTASPPVDSGFDRLAMVNYQVLKGITETMLPAMLRRQSGTVLMIGSTALGHYPPGWDDYVAAKAMSASYVDGLAARYSRYGVRGMMLSPGFVRTAYSDKWRNAATAALLPEEVAEVAADMLAPDSWTGNHFLWLEPGDARSGTWGFQSGGVNSRRADDHDIRVEPADVGRTADTAGFEMMVRQLLKLPPQFPLSGAGLGRTPGWDSLRHIELVLGIEREYGIGFSAKEMEMTHDFDALTNLYKQKVTS